MKQIRKHLLDSITLAIVSCWSSMKPAQSLIKSPVQFEYAPGHAGPGIASLSTVNAGLTGAANDFSVLPFPSRAVIVDFDRDGLPDVVQSSEAPQCTFTRAVAVRDSCASGNRSCTAFGS